LDSYAPQEVLLPADRPVVIGSDPGCDLVLAGLGDVHAVVVRDEWDEFVVVDRSGGETTVDGQVADRIAVHTGDVIRLRDAELVFQRDEASDHGRPYSGREGGEGSLQREQPSPEIDESAPGAGIRSPGRSTSKPA
jgi:hypothetical protein